MTDVDYIAHYWHYADTQEDDLLGDIDDEEADLHDDLQDILDHFRNIQLTGNITRAEVNRLHRKIDQWQRAGYDVGEFKLIMRDLDNRTRIKGNEALLAFLIAAFIGFYQPVMEESREMIFDVSQEAYKREFKEAQKITEKGNMSPPSKSTVREWTNGPIPSGGTFENDIYADAVYRARKFQKMINADKLLEKEPLDIDNAEYKRALEIQRKWYLRRTGSGTYPDNHSGEVDMYLSYVVSETVVRAFIDAGVKKYQFIATIDDRTTNECRERHLKIFNMKDVKIGYNCPPIYPPPHPCRSIIRAVE